MAADPKAFLKTGQVTSSWELMREYGFADADGRRPDMGRVFRDRIPRRHVYQTALARSHEWQRRLLETTTRMEARDRPCPPAHRKRTGMLPKLTPALLQRRAAAPGPAAGAEHPPPPDSSAARHA